MSHDECRPRRRRFGRVERRIRSAASSRLAKVWIISILSRATVVPVAFYAAAFLQNDRSTVLALTALSALGFIATVIAFLYDASYAATNSTRTTQNYTVFFGVIVAITAITTAAAASAGPVVALILIVTFGIQRRAIEMRQRLLLAGELGLPYLGITLRSLSLLAFLAGWVWSSNAIGPIAVSACFLTSGILELLLYRMAAGAVSVPGTPRSAEARPIYPPLSLPLGYTLFCTLPWLLRVVTATSADVGALRILEYADRLSYLAVSGVLGGLATELQRRWAAMEDLSSAHREARILGGVLMATGFLTGLAAAAVAPTFFSVVDPGEQLAIVAMGVAAGAWGSITVAERLLITQARHGYLGRTLLPFEAATALLVIGGGHFGLMGSVSTYTFGLTALAFFLGGTSWKKRRHAT